jgi:small subunit ribosomal protein S17
LNAEKKNNERNSGQRQSSEDENIAVERTIKHPVYGRIICVKSKFSVHDEKNESKMGDLVSIMEARPLSKTKRWVLTEIVNKA